MLNTSELRRIEVTSGQCNVRKGTVLYVVEGMDDYRREHYCCTEKTGTATVWIRKCNAKLLDKE